MYFNYIIYSIIGNHLYFLYILKKDLFIIIFESELLKFIITDIYNYIINL